MVHKTNVIPAFTELTAYQSRDTQKHVITIKGDKVIKEEIEEHFGSRVLWTAPSPGK